MGKVQCYPHICFLVKNQIIAKYSTWPPPVPVPPAPAPRYRGEGRWYKRVNQFMFVNYRALLQWKPTIYINQTVKNLVQNKILIALGKIVSYLQNYYSTALLLNF